VPFKPARPHNPVIERRQRITGLTHKNEEAILDFTPSRDGFFVTASSGSQRFVHVSDGKHLKTGLNTGSAAPEYRGKGMESAVVAHLLELAAEHGGSLEIQRIPDQRWLSHLVEKMGGVRINSNVRWASEHLGPDAPWHAFLLRHAKRE